MANTKITQVHNVNPEELTESISTAVEKIFAPFKENFQLQKPTEWITRKQVGELLSISLVTVDDWTDRNLLTAYRISNKKRFKLSEVEKALTKINN
jgi:excisionase family DNA binding protein